MPAADGAHTPHPRPRDCWRVVDVGDRGAAWRPGDRVAGLRLPGVPRVRDTACITCATSAPVRTLRRSAAAPYVLAALRNAVIGLLRNASCSASHRGENRKSVPDTAASLFVAVKGCRVFMAAGLGKAPAR